MLYEVITLDGTETGPGASRRRSSPCASHRVPGGGGLGAGRGSGPAVGVGRKGIALRRAGSPGTQSRVNEEPQIVSLNGERAGLAGEGRTCHGRVGAVP